MYGVDRSIYRTRLWQSANPRAVAKVTEMRRQVLNQDAELCELTADFSCYSNTGRRGYATASVLDANYKRFCSEVNMGGRASASRTFNIGTPEENVFRITRNTVSLFDREACLEAFGRIIHGCVPGLSNPMNHKFGGHLKQDGILYEVNVTPTTRPWPPPVAPYGACQAGSQFSAGSFFEFKGAGWATWDHGQESLLPALQRCLSGGRIASWNFEYFDQPDKDGYEWRVDFAVQARMQHLEMCGTEKYLVAAAGGLTGSCSGVSRKFA